jgi:hypothetical protein
MFLVFNASDGAIVVKSNEPTCVITNIHFNKVMIAGVWDGLKHFAIKLSDIEPNDGRHALECAR